jgi:phage shock protein A
MPLLWWRKGGEAMSVYCQNCDHLRAENKQLQAELTTAKACEHKNTIHGELKGLTHFELCIDCGMSRAEDEQVPSGWMRNSHACKNAARQWRKLQAELDKAKAENEDLCDNIDAVRQEIADYLNGTLEGKLRDENKWLRKEVKKRNGAVGVMGQVAVELKRITGKQNVWKAMKILEQALKESE